MNDTPVSKELREKLLETINYIRFEQEWNAMSHIAANHRMSDHEIECKVCQKMFTLNNESVDAILSTIIDSLPEAYNGQFKSSYKIGQMMYPENNTHGLAFENGYNKAIDEVTAIFEKAREE